MTERFQKTVQALEEESQAEKRQLQAMHQQRIISQINQKKKLAMSCFTTALNDNPVITQRVQKCLQKLLRALHKDRHHSIQHYKHLLVTNFEQAAREKEVTIDHLADIDRLVSESLEMLSKNEEMNAKILPLMEDYLIALRSRDNTPATLLRMDRSHEQDIIDNFTNEIRQKIKAQEQEKMMEKQERIQERKQELEMETTRAPLEVEPKTEESVQTLKIEVHATATHHKEVDPIVAHAMSHEFSHGEAVSKFVGVFQLDVYLSLLQGYSVRKVNMEEDNKSVYLTLTFVGMALLAAIVAGFVVVKKRNGRHPHHQVS